MTKKSGDERFMNKENDENRAKRENSQNSFLFETLTTNQQIIIINFFKRPRRKMTKKLRL